MKKASRNLESKRARRIWSKHNGPIPVDESGVTFDIHHRDGDWNNNNPANLQALSVLDHYRLHFAQGDWAAAWYISKRLTLTPADYEQIRGKISAALKGRVMSPEWRARISQALTGRKADPAVVEKQRVANTGRKYGPEYGRKITERQLGTRATEEARRNMSAAHRGKKASAETRLKMSAARKGQYRDPDATRRMVETRRANGTYGKKS
jgi:HNH endonuclease/NUMOD3 motif